MARDASLAPPGRVSRVIDDSPGKGRPTRSRKEAEALRKQQMKRPTGRREQMRRERERRSKLREKQLAALDGRGDATYLPARDRGAVRALVRDYIDRRRSVAEYMLPILVVILVLSFIPNPTAVTVVFFLWSVTILSTVVDEVFLVVGLKRELKRRFEPGEAKGAVTYGVLRSTQLRRTRRPRPTIQRGEPLRERY
ncbi:DUF3043 domain-containing protein [Aeromicrobium phragmitis]|uniref:DUF3043 domain-containing protein n=1 Tax=Aeromicrobium phragmitis TaxID=2478914 RepID=A0A3L8PKN1_9ACTN|nr:DUF3043 domain-containing protein [Aeromicrobium phragmitis]